MDGGGGGKDRLADGARTGSGQGLRESGAAGREIEGPGIAAEGASARVEAREAAKPEPACRCGVNRDGLEELQKVPGMDQALRIVAAVAVTLAAALAFYMARLPVPAILVLVALIVAGVVYLSLDVHAARTAQGRALIYTRRVAGTPMRVLRQGGVYQSATYLGPRRFEPVFAYHRAFDVMFDQEESLRAAGGHGIRRVLALGGGGYAWPKHALTEHPGLVMDVVEIDPAVEQVARRWFFVDELKEIAGDRLRLVVADGREYLKGASACYDAVVNDTFVGAVPARRLSTVEAARAVRNSLVPDGVYLTNVVSAGEGSDLTFLRDEVATLATVFKRVFVLPATDDELGGEDNYLVMATDAPVEVPEAVPFDDGFLGTVLHDDEE